MLHGGLRCMPHPSLLALTLSWPIAMPWTTVFGNWAAFGDEILAKEDNKASALTMPPLAPPTAVLPTPHRPTTYKDAVLATMGGSLRVKSLVVTPFSCPSTMVNDQPQTAYHCSRPRCRVGRHHGPWAPNP